MDLFYCGTKEGWHIKKRTLQMYNVIKLRDPLDSGLKKESRGSLFLVDIISSTCGPFCFLFILR